VSYKFQVCEKCGLVEVLELKPPAQDNRPMGLGSRTYSRGHFERLNEMWEQQEELARLYKIKRNQCRCNVSSQSAKRTQTSSLTNELVKLKDLFDQGVLTREQFERAKNKLLE
jgi:multidrug resistance efflux pump